MSFGRGGFGATVVQHSNTSPAYVHVVPQAIRSSEDPSVRCPSACHGTWGSVPTMGVRATPRGDWHSVKDTGLRRDNLAGLGLPSRDRCGNSALHSGGKAARKPGDPSTQQRRGEPLPGVATRKSRSSEVGASCISLSSRRGFARLCQQVPSAGFGAAERKVEEHELHPQVPKGGTPSPSVPSSSRRRSAKVRRRRKSPSTHSARGALSVAASLVLPVFIEIFSGCGILGHTIAKANDWYDLRILRNRQKIFGWLRSGKVRGGHLGTPCSTVSRARDHPPGPPPLRSDMHVMGLPSLQGANLQKVLDGNFYMRFSASLMRLALLLMIPFTMENPARSRIWLCPAMLRLQRCRNTHFAIFEMCMFGCAWRKATGVLATHICLDFLQQFRCLGAKRGFFHRTGKPHVQLCELTPAGQWRTKAAQAYPVKLCQRLAQVFFGVEASRVASRFANRLS